METVACQNNGFYFFWSQINRIHENTKSVGQDFKAVFHYTTGSAKSIVKRFVFQLLNQFD